MNRILVVLFMLLFCAESFAQSTSTNPTISYADYDAQTKKSFLITLDGRDLSTIDKIPLGEKIPSDLAIHPTMPIAYIANDPVTSSGITVVDLKSKQVKTLAVTDKKIISLYLPRAIATENILYALSNEGELIQLAISNFNLTIKNSILASSSNSHKDPIKAVSFGIRGFAAGVTNSQLISFQFREGIIIDAAREIQTPNSLQAIAVESRIQAIGAGINGIDTTIDTYEIGSLNLLAQASLPKRIFAIKPIVDSIYAAGDDKIFILTANGDLRGEIPVPAPKAKINVGRSQIIPKVFFNNDDGLGLQSGEIMYYLNSQGITLISLLNKSSITTLPWSKYAVGMYFSGDFTGIAPSVNIVNPGPEVQAIDRGKLFKVEVKATTSKFAVALYRIELSIDGGNTFNSIGELAGSEKIFNWNVPDQDIESALLKVTAFDYGGYRGEVLSQPFKIERVIPPDTEAPTVRFLNPLGNEIFNSGDSLNITWTAADNVGVTFQELLLSTDGGATFPITIATGLDGSIQTYTFQLPDEDIEKGRLKLIVSDQAGNVTEAKTGANFKIKKEVASNVDKEAPAVSFQNPVGGEVFLTGSSINIIWRSTDNVGVVSQDLELSLDDGASFTILIAGGLGGNSQSFSYKLGEIETDRARLRLVVKDASGNVSEAISPASFSILSQTGGNQDKESPEVKFMSPVGGEGYFSGDRINITWNATDNVGVFSQDIALSTDGGSTFPFPVVSGVSGSTQSFTYLIPSTVTTENARLRLVASDLAGNITQVASGAFSIRKPTSSSDTQPPTITISKPLGGNAPAGQPVSVLWVSRDNVAVSNHTISISLDGGKTFQTLTNLAGDIQEYQITTSSIIDKSISEAIVKISVADATGNKAEASSKFTINPVITNAAYKNKQIDVMGIGFTGASSQTSLKVFINDVEIDSKFIKSASNTLITVKGSKKKLNLKPGVNRVYVTVAGSKSETVTFVR